MMPKLPYLSTAEPWPPKAKCVSRQGGKKDNWSLSKQEPLPSLPATGDYRKCTMLLLKYCQVLRECSLRQVSPSHGARESPTGNQTGNGPCHGSGDNSHAGSAGSWGRLVSVQPFWSPRLHTRAFTALPAFLTNQFNSTKNINSVC